MLSGGFAQSQCCLCRQQQPGRSSLCLPNASRTGLCESAFLQSKPDSGERQEAVRGTGSLVGRRMEGDLVKKGQPVSWGWSHAVDLQSAPSRFLLITAVHPSCAAAEVNKHCEQCLPAAGDGGM